MAGGTEDCPEHKKRTRRRELRYCFSAKHHGRDSTDASQWADDLSRDEEFTIFEEADEHDLSDPNGHLYGLRRSPDGAILDLGTSEEQIAKFPRAREGQLWHGFPLWPLAEDGPENRKKQKAPRAALRKMKEKGLLSPQQLKKLLKGDPT